MRVLHIIRFDKRTIQFVISGATLTFIIGLLLVKENKKVKEEKLWEPS